MIRPKARLERIERRLGAGRLSRDERIVRAYYDALTDDQLRAIIEAGGKMPADVPPMSRATAHAFEHVEFDGLRRAPRLQRLTDDQLAALVAMPDSRLEAIAATGGEPCELT